MPRTVVEFQTIVGELLASGTARQSLPTDRPLRVLDLGSGTGGAWLGLASALLNAGHVGELAVHAVDGNATALRTQHRFAKALATQGGMAVALQTTQRVLGHNPKAFQCHMAELLAELGGEFDFILVSKHLSELYDAGGTQAQGIVAEAILVLNTALSANGYLVLLDVTTKVDERQGYFPKLMAREAARVLSAPGATLRPVLPLACARHMAAGCAGLQSCYMQRELRFEHLRAASGAPLPAHTKVVYFVLAKQANALRVTADWPKAAGHCANCQTAQLEKPVQPVQILIRRNSAWPSTFAPNQPYSPAKRQEIFA